MNKIQLSKVNKCFGDKFCLKDINLEVNGGEIYPLSLFILRYGRDMGVFF